MIGSLIRRHALATTGFLLLAGMAVSPFGWAWLGGPAPQKPEPAILAPLHPDGSAYQSVVLGGALWLPRAMPDGVALHGPTARFPGGVLYAVHDDKALAAFDLREVARTLRIAPTCIQQ